MPYHIVYLLPDHGIPFTESKKGASIHARCMIDAFLREGNEVTVYCLRKGKARQDKRYRLATPDNGRWTNLFVKRFYRCYAKGRLAPHEAALRYPLPLLAAGLGLLAGGIGLWVGLALAALSLGASFLLAGGIGRGQARPVPNWVEATFMLLRHYDLYRQLRLHAKRFRDPEGTLLYARNSWFAWPCFMAARRYGLPLMLEVNTVCWLEKDIRREAAFRPLARYLERRNFQAADLLLCVSETVRDQAVAAGAPTERCLVTPNAVDLEHFRSGADQAPPPRLEGRYVVGLVSSFRPFHGAALLVEAADILRHKIPELLVWLIGSGPEEEAVRRQVEARGLGDIVRFEGPVDYAQLPAHLARFDVATAPYMGEQNTYGSPMKIYEYMAAGRPVVSARWGQAARLVREGETGLFHEPGDAKGLAERILELHDQPELARRIVEGADLFIQGKTWTAIWREALDELISRSVLPDLRRSDYVSPYARARREAEARRLERWKALETEREEFLRHSPERYRHDPQAPLDLDDRQALPLCPPEPPPPVELPFQDASVQPREFHERIHRETEQARRREAERPAPGLPEGRPLRVLRVISSASMGGVAKVMNQTLLRLDPDRVETTVLVFGQPGHLSPRLTRAPGLRYLTRPMDLCLHSWNRRIFRHIEEIAQLLRDEKIDLVHLHEPNCAPALRLAADRAGLPLLVHLHNDYTDRHQRMHPFHRDMIRKSLQELPLIGCSVNMADGVFRYLCNQELRETKPIPIAEDGCDDIPLWGRDEKLDAWLERRAQGRLPLLCIGRIIPHKHLPAYLEACRTMANLGHPVFTLLVAYGDPPEMDELKRHFQRLFDPEEGELFYHLPSPNDLLDRTQLAVSTSALEGLPMTLLEFMAHGVPIVCSDIVAHVQIVENEANGLLYELGDGPDLLRQLHRALSDEALRRRLADEARARLAPRRWQRSAQANLETYHRLLRGEWPPTPPPFALRPERYHD